ncbi:MAG: CFI-box-CTERM domain-containing protein [Dehalococcoidia bacterium]
MNRILILLTVFGLLVGVGLWWAAPVVGEDGIINVPGDYSTIQGAIDAASHGDTIMVAAGLYEESVVIDKSLTLKGEQAGVDARSRSGDEAIIEAVEDDIGISILTSEGCVVVIDGLTVQNALHAMSTPEAGVMAAHIEVRNLRVLNSGDFGISLTFTEELIVEYCYVENARIGINAGALVPYPATVATFRNNELVNVKFGFTGYLQDSLIEGNVVRCTVKDKDVSEGTGISGQFFDTEVRSNSVSGYADGAGMSFAWHYGRGISENVKVEGNTFTKNRRGIQVFCDQTDLKGIVVNFNNIFDNTGPGVQNEGGQALDARKNWWGDASGPYNATANRDGKGNSVSAKVDFRPWLGAPVVDVQTETVADGIVDGRDGSDTEIEVIGTATVTLARYGDNPGAVPRCLTALGKYIDAYIADTGSVDEIEIRLHYSDAEAGVAGVDEESLWLFWWDGTEWVQCSDSGVNTGGTGGYSGYIWARLAHDTVPSLAQLVGTPFAGYEVPPPVPYVATAELPAGEVGSAYEAALEACGGQEPYNWAVAEGTLPHGLELNGGTGIISGTPTAASSFEFTVSVTDAALAAASAQLSITITAPGPLPCFIATAAYGADTGEEIDILREFRDTALMPTTLGAGLVSLYYRTSPAVAGFISGHEMVRSVVRVGLVAPIVAVLNCSQDWWADGGW